MRKFLLDDVRDVKVDVVCRTARKAYVVLRKERFDVYYFDHDLGKTAPGTSGYDVLKWALANDYLSEHCKVVLVTSNPVGKYNMGNILTDYGFKRLGDTYVK